MRYSTFDEISNVLVTCLNYWHAATKFWMSAARKGVKDSESLRQLENRALSLVGELYDACSHADNIKEKSAEPEPLLSELASRVEMFHRTVAQCVMFEVLAAHEDCPPKIRQALGTARENTEKIGKILWRQNAEMTSASQEALAFVFALEEDLTIEEAKEKYSKE